MADDPATKPIRQAKLMKHKVGERSDDSTTKLAGPSKISKTADQESSDYATTECESKELEGVLLHTRRLTVCDRFSETYFTHGREGEKSGHGTVMMGDARRKLHAIEVDEWMSTGDETLLVIRDYHGLGDLISILAPLCPSVKHFSIEMHSIYSSRSTHIPTSMPMTSVITVCIKSWHCYETLLEALLAVSKYFPNAESLDAQMKDLRSPSKQAYFHEVNSSSSLMELKLRYEGCSSYHCTTDSLLMDISTSCPNIVSLVLSGFGGWRLNKSGKDIISCKMPHLTNIQLDPFGTDDCYRFVTLMNVLHVGHVISPCLRFVEAKKVQLGDAELSSVKWSRTSSGCELQLEGASVAVPMADLMYLVSNELEGVTVLIFDRCKVYFPQSISHPLQGTGEESSLRELKFLNVECPLSQTDILKLSEMNPNVKVTVEHESQASHEDSKQGTGMPFKPERKTSPTSSIDEVNVKPMKMECCKRIGVEGGRLRLDSFGIELEIPPGAIASEVPQDISLRVLTDTPNLGNSKEETSVCFGVQCLAPDDLVIKLPVTYTIPHCAVIIRYSSVKAVLYTGEGEYSPDAVVKERIMLSGSGIPSFTIRKDVLQLKMNHFSWAKIKLRINNFFFRGKTMCCRPFREKNLQKTPVILHAHLYDEITGNRELVESKEEKHGFVPAHMELQVLIQTAECDLKMTCYVKKTVIGGPAVVPFERLMSEARICRPFQLDFTNQPDIVAVSLIVGQIDSVPDEFLFRLDFSTPLRTDLEGASPPDPGRQEDFDGKLKYVAKKVVKYEEIDDLGKELGCTPEEIQLCVDTNMKNPRVSYMGTLSMLRDWRKKQTKAKECEALKDVLEKVGQIHLADELFGTS